MILFPFCSHGESSDRVCFRVETIDPAKCQQGNSQL